MRRFRRVFFPSAWSLPRLSQRHSDGREEPPAPDDGNVQPCSFTAAPTPSPSPRPPSPCAPRDPPSLVRLIPGAHLQPSRHSALVSLSRCIRNALRLPRRADGLLQPSRVRNRLPGASHAPCHGTAQRAAWKPLVRSFCFNLERKLTLQQHQPRRTGRQRHVARPSSRHGSLGSSPRTLQHPLLGPTRRQPHLPLAQVLPHGR